MTSQPHYADEILPGLWLGNLEASQDRNFLKNHNITVIINCTKDLPFLPLSGVYLYRVPVDDNLQPAEIKSMTGWLERIIPILRYHLAHGRHILVHCYAGMQRSAIVVLCYLFQYGDNRHRELHGNSLACYKHMRQRRPIVFQPSMNFRNSFMSRYGSHPELPY
jgi:hypothetical protein